MDQKRLFLAISLSLLIMIGFQTLISPQLPKPAEHATVQTGQTAGKTTAPVAGSPGGAVATAASQVVPKDVPRVKIEAPRVRGSISLLGARIDDLVLLDYRETLSATSPFVRILEPRSDAKPYYAQYGWTAPAGETVKVPDNDTVSAPTTPARAAALVSVAGTVPE